MADAIPSVAVSPAVHPADGMDRWLGEEQLFRTAIEHTPDYAFILFDPENRVLRWNGGAEKAFGYTESEILGAPGSLFFVPEDRANGAVEEEFTTAQRDGKAEDERWHLRKDGSRFWSNGVMRPLYDGSGQLKGFLKILRDLTTQKQAQEQLERSEEQLRLFVENVTDYALFQVDPHGLVTSWNTGAQRITGYAEGDILGRHLSLLCTQDDLEARYIDSELDRALAKGSAEKSAGLYARRDTAFGRAG